MCKNKFRYHKHNANVMSVLPIIDSISGDLLRFRLVGHGTVTVEGVGSMLEFNLDGFT